MNIRYCGPAKDYSGYGEANRHDIHALISAGFDVSVECTRHCLEMADFGELSKMVGEREMTQNGYQVKILHTTPNLFGQFIEPNKYHIGRVFWETDMLPPDFAKGAQMCDEIWTGSEFNRQAIIKAGVTKPIYIIPEAIYLDTTLDSLEPFIVELPETTYKFYSIFEWTERKNPEALLEAYFKAFQNNEDVCLILKTYVDNFTPGKRNLIQEFIKKIKIKLNLPTYPPLRICTELLDRTQMYRFHKTFDCFVSAHRGEGWGIPQMEAMLTAHPVISTGCGGIHEYITTARDGFTIGYTMVPIGLASRNPQWYCADQNWAEVDILTLSDIMKFLHENQKLAKEIGENAKQTVISRFSSPVVGQLMKARLNVIAEKLGIE